MFGTFRLFLAFNVVLFHILKIPNVGPFAVYSFFILSGLLMTTIMHETYSYSVNGLKKYMLNRFLRLYPVYWSLLLVTVIIIIIVGCDFTKVFHEKMQIPMTIKGITANITMLYVSFYPVNFSPRLAPATWALTIELFFYLLIGVGISKNKSITIVWCGISSLYIIYLNFIGQFGLSYGNFITASFPFSIGSLVYFYKEKILFYIKYILSEKYSIIFIIFILNLIAGGCADFFRLDISWKIQIFTAFCNVFLSVLIVTILIFAKTKNRSIEIIDRFLGDLSYPVYIFHLSGALVSTWIINKIKINNVLYHDMLVFVGCLIFTILMSILVNKIVNDRVELLRSVVKGSRRVSDTK